MEDILKYDDKKELTTLMARALKKENWKEFFCKNEKNQIGKFYREESEVREAARMFEFGGFNSPEQADAYLRETLDMHIEDIADFLMSPRRIMSTITICNETVGYVYGFCSTEREDTNKFKMVLHKDRDHNTEFGFFVSTIIPIR